MDAGWQVEAVQLLTDVEELSPERLAVRAGWPVEQVRALLEGERSLTDDEARHVFSCFGLDRRLRPFDPDTFAALGEARSMSMGERFEAGRTWSEFFNGMRLRAAGGRQ